MSTQKMWTSSKEHLMLDCCWRNFTILALSSEDITISDTLFKIYSLILSSSQRESSHNGNFLTKIGQAGDFKYSLELKINEKYYLFVRDSKHTGHQLETYQVKNICRTSL